MIHLQARHLLLAWLAAAGMAEAAAVNASFSPVGPLWEVGLTVINDGAPAEIGHFTVYFGEDMYSNLALTHSPAGWDSLVVQPDLSLPDAGFLDAMVLPGTPALTLGQQQAGFKVQFAYSGVGTPGPLHYDITDASYNLLFQGQTVPVPEPGTAVLGLLGLAVLAARLRRVRRSATASPLRSLE